MLALSPLIEPTKSKQSLKTSTHSNIVRWQDPKGVKTLSWTEWVGRGKAMCEMSLSCDLLDLCGIQNNWTMVTVYLA